MLLLLRQVSLLLVVIEPDGVVLSRPQFLPVGGMLEDSLGRTAKMKAWLRSPMPRQQLGEGEHVMAGMRCLGEVSPIDVG